MTRRRARDGSAPGGHTAGKRRNPGRISRRSGKTSLPDGRNGRHSVRPFSHNPGNRPQSGATIWITDGKCWITDGKCWITGGTFRISVGTCRMSGATGCLSGGTCRLTGEISRLTAGTFCLSGGKCVPGWRSGMISRQSSVRWRGSGALRRETASLPRGSHGRGRRSMARLRGSPGGGRRHSGRTGRYTFPPPRFLFATGARGAVTAS